MSKSTKTKLPIHYSLICLCCIVLTAYFIIASHKFLSDREEEKLEIETNRTSLVIESLIKKHSSLLRAGEALIKASNKVTSNEWITFINLLRSEEIYIGIENMFFIDSKDLTNRQDEMIRVALASNFTPEEKTLHEINKIDWSKYSSTPTSVSLSSEGFDLDHKLKLLTLPIFSKDANNSAKVLIGVVGATLDFQKLLTSKRLGLSPEHQLKIQSAGKLLFEYPETLNSKKQSDPSNKVFSKSINLLGEEVTIYVSSNPDYSANILFDQTWQIVFAGVLVNALLIALLLYISKNNSNFRTYNQALTRLVKNKSKIEVELRKNNLQMEKLTLKAQGATRAKSAFLANVSHELRTPLNGVLGAIELLKRTNQTEAQKRHCSIAEFSAKTLITIINQVLDFSKLESGSLQSKKSACHLEKLLENLIEVIAHSAFEKEVEICMYISPNIAEHIQMDGDSLNQVLLNLLSNAVKFTKQGSISLVVRLKDNRLYFDISDTGIGIAQCDLDSIFRPFTQVENRSMKNPVGTGLGLSISSELVRSMKGEIQLESTLGKGSRFFFDLPYQPIGPNCIIPQSSASILLIYRCKDAGALALNQIREFGFDVQLVHSISEGIEELVKSNFDFVAVDSRICTDDFLKHCQSIPSLTPVYIKALGKTLDKEHLSELGVSKFLTKPITPSRIKRVFISKENSEVPVNVETKSSLSKHLLLAEDNEVNQLVATEILAELGCTYDLASNGEEAVALAQTENYDLILMDCQMPKLDGYGATKNIRDAGIATPIVALTASAIKGEKQRCIEIGMNDCLIKPVTIEAVKATILAYSIAGPKKPTVVNTEEMFSRFQNNAKLILIALGRFSEQLTSDIPALGLAIEDENHQVVFELCHSIKGAAEVLSAHSISKEAKTLESMGLSGETKDALPVFEELSKQCASFKEQLKSIEVDLISQKTNGPENHPSN